MIDIDEAKTELIALELKAIPIMKFNALIFDDKSFTEEYLQDRLLNGYEVDVQISTYFLPEIKRANFFYGRINFGIFKGKEIDNFGAYSVLRSKLILKTFIWRM